MHMINFIYNIAGKTEMKLSKEAIENMSLPEFFQLARAEQEGKIKVIIEE